ncbi:MAG: SNF2 helicase associated domain-containing protein, partial [Planctomycetales bacterium]|nr:SNF2 helicase associated domain-containing protein [Planctomycetales bacterium]
KKDGEWAVPRRRNLTIRELQNETDEHVRKLAPFFDTGEYSYNPVYSLTLRPMTHEVAIPMLVESERFVWTLGDEWHPIQWDEGDPWEVVLQVEPVEPRWADAKPRRSDGWRVRPLLRRGAESRPIDTVLGTFPEGLLLFSDSLARVALSSVDWLLCFHRSGDIHFPWSEMDEILHSLCMMPELPLLEVAEAAQISHTVGSPVGKLVLEKPSFGGTSKFQAKPAFLYDDVEVSLTDNRSAIWNEAQRSVVHRDLAGERELLRELVMHPAFRAPTYGDEYYVPTANITQIVADLTDQGWEVVAAGKLIRTASHFNIGITTDTDWFDMQGYVDFGGTQVPLPRLLQAVKQKQNFVKLDDGSQGMLPLEWLQKYVYVAGLGEVDGDSVRYARSQALLLDAFLGEQGEVTWDERFLEWRDKLQSFEGIEPVSTPEGFTGELRPYQSEGLAWLNFLQQFQLGGCLADDMGLGKTIQVLALLESRRHRRVEHNEVKRPSIVVVPKSLVFNWIEEAARFTPQLKVLNYTGSQRTELVNAIESTDVVITTYGTLRRDILELRKIPFDYAVLDEAQAIKNANSQASKACRLLRATHRLAMTGTPVENHVGELWALFEFLNPGMLGGALAFSRAAKGGAFRENDQFDSLEILRRSIRPYILRRTKNQVLTDLPGKTEQSLYCEMTPSQKKQYDELLAYYRAHIDTKVKEIGVKRAKIHVLEALLRLRQAACDPRLLDDSLTKPGAKIELLLQQLDEVLDEGHKVLVFSQFTSLLALVRKSVESSGWDYEYLDGRTRNRAEHVKRFQTDESCRLFLISLKAGGHGLNLTAADYVFILDPWWNPAVEAQAVDRAHRIGQTRPVMAYRMICRGTVEEKIVELKRQKQELADAIISADESLISSLTADDLRMLLGG